MRFGAVGLAATGTYAAATLALSGSGLANVWASALGYLLAIPVSFAGQKYFTFQAAGWSRSELVRFLIVQAINLVLAAVIMTTVADVLGYGRVAGVLAVVVSVPLITYLLLRTAVFTARG
jgi:putative flippase GtrA